MTEKEAKNPIPRAGMERPPSPEAREKTRAFLGDESKRKKACLSLEMSGPPGYPGLRVSLRGDGRLRRGNRQLPPLAPERTGKILDLFIEESFTEIEDGTTPGLPDEILVTLELKVGLWRRHRISRFVGSSSPRFDRLVAALQALAFHA